MDVAVMKWKDKWKFWLLHTFDWIGHWLLGCWWCQQL